MDGERKPNRNVVRKEFVAQFAQRTGMTRAEAEKTVQAFLDVLAEDWIAGRSVVFSKFGVFDLRKTNARAGRNPRTGQDAPIPAGYKPVFRVSEQLRDRINAQLADPK